MMAANPYMSDPPGDGEDPDQATDDAEDTSDLPADFKQAYEDYEQDPSPQTFWDAVEACTSGKSGGGLALLIGGKPKTKK